MTDPSTAPPIAEHGLLEGSEGTFSLCTFSWVEALARVGRLEEVDAALDRDGGLPITADGNMSGLRALMPPVATARR
ncbi:MAG: hypothetical protein ACXV3A_04565 [Kineosporiaceae bacterium]